MDAQTLGGRGGARSSFALHDIEPHPLRFDGSGGGYFRVWIVNVLLTILTLGLYTPWARRRTAQYFYGHTLVAGSPLEFTAQQRRMVVGFIAVALLTLAYKIAARTGQELAVGLLLLGGALLSPLIWGSAMRFRLGNTRWRGVRLAFNASWGEVYRASWPVFAIALVVPAVYAGLRLLAPARGLGGDAPRGLFTAPMGALLATGVVLVVLCVIRLEFNYRSLLVRRAGLGEEGGRFKVRYRDFVWLWLATLAVFIASALVLGALAAVGPAVLLGGSRALGDLGFLRPGFGRVMFILVAVVLVLLVLALATAPARAYREAALFRLAWNHTGVGDVARFKCRLRVGAFIVLRLRNALLTLLTLGLFRPFARVSEYRMKLESVTVHVKGGVDQVAGRLARRQAGGIGDAMADAAGLDLIG